MGIVTGTPYPGYDFDIENFVFEEHVLKACEGTYDVHLHALPDAKYRKYDIVEVMQDMDKLGMAGCVYKLKGGTTCSQAQILNYYAGTNAKVIGSLCIGRAIGGFNPEAIRQEAKMGLKIVWMPTYDAALEQYHKVPVDKQVPGLYILDPIGNLKPEVIEMLKVMQDNKIAVATGHMSVPEVVALTKAARQMNIEVILTHPRNIIGTLEDDVEEYRISDEILKELIDLGAYIEILGGYSYHRRLEDGTFIIDGDNPYIGPEKYVAMIRKFGADHFVIGTEGGCITNSYCCEYYHFIDGLMKHGISVEEIQTMARFNVEKILNL